MTNSAFASTAIHNTACESAAQANCHCKCHGAGHQFDLILRAATCATQSEEDSLRRDLERVFGGFHSRIRDVATTTRGFRTVLSPFEASTLKITTGKGATWAETLLVDEAVHAAFIDIAHRSRALSAKERLDRGRFVTRVTRNSIRVVGGSVAANNIANSHVWCSIVAEFTASLTVPASSSGKSNKYDQICFPRATPVKTPSHLPMVLADGLKHLAAEYKSAGSLSAEDKLHLLRLVGMATCADPWHHPATVRHCIFPVVAAATWPPSNSTVIATAQEMRVLKHRWLRKGHW